MRGHFKQKNRKDHIKNKKWKRSFVTQKNMRGHFKHNVQCIMFISYFLLAY